MTQIIGFRRRRRRKTRLTRLPLALVLALVIGAGAALFDIDLSAISSKADQATQSETALTGRASVIDGDTIDIQGERFRFNGIDAPESWQRCEDGRGVEYRCGKAAAEALDAFLAQSRPTRCEYTERDRYGRFVGDCYRGDGESVNRWMMRSGHALDFPQYSGGEYAGEQDLARAERIGMWQGRFVEPWKARAERR